MFEIPPKWFKWSLLSLVLVAFFGFLMRYKVIFNIPFLEQENLLHAHSHFAFSAWISHTLYYGLVILLEGELSKSRKKIYNWLIGLNLLSAYGMLISFTIQGYKVISIIFSTMTIVIALLYYIQFYRDSSTSKKIGTSIHWARIGLFLNVISAIGPFSLVYLIINKISNTDYYNSSIHFFLHFQYNGWFFFGAMALASQWLDFKNFNTLKYCKLFAITVFPTYGLFILWADLPAWVHTLIILGTIVQLIAYIHLLFSVYFHQKNTRFQKLNFFEKIFLYSSMIALLLKYILQASSSHPNLSQIVLESRSIVITYLHLILLGVFSFFIFFYALKQKLLILNNLSKSSMIIFFIGVICNEVLLGFQGLTSVSNIFIPYTNELLLVVSIFLFSSAATLFYSQIYRKSSDTQLIF
ncbi:MAG: hypothetical protein IT267_06370 [Saprospiraceae bacterium]|nr:hypothetical protein [Saprospiraceae bacterium]